MPGSIPEESQRSAVVSMGPSRREASTAAGRRRRPRLGRARKEAQQDRLARPGRRAAVGGRRADRGGADLDPAERQARRQVAVEVHARRRLRTEAQLTAQHEVFPVGGERRRQRRDAGRPAQQRGAGAGIGVVAEALPVRPVERRRGRRPGQLPGVDELDVLTRHGVRALPGNSERWPPLWRMLRMNTSVLPACDTVGPAEPHTAQERDDD